MPFFRRGGSRPEPSEPTPVELPVNLASDVLNAIGRELNVVLPESAITNLSAAQAALTSDITGAYEQERALAALDWLTRTWFGTWCRIVPDSGDALAAELGALAPIQDIYTATAVGGFVAVMAGTPEQTAKFVQENYDRDNLFESIALGAAEKASSEAFRNSMGPAIADVAASYVMSECRAAQADVALAAISSLSLSHCLDELWPFIVDHANRPGDIDAKTISIRNLAPYAALQPLKPIVERLQASVGELYVSLARMG